jgi:hypothetical protein
MDNIDQVLEMISAEREKQELRKNDGRFKYTCADSDGMGNYEKLAVLMEEVGEVAIECLSIDHTRELRGGARGTTLALREEIIQVAAVAAAWAESLL